MAAQRNYHHHDFCASLDLYQCSFRHQVPPRRPVLWLNQRLLDLDWKMDGRSHVRRVHRVRFNFIFLHALHKQRSLRDCLGRVQLRVGSKCDDVLE